MTRIEVVPNLGIALRRVAIIGSEFRRNRRLLMSPIYSRPEVAAIPGAGHGKRSPVRSWQMVACWI